MRLELSGLAEPVVGAPLGGGPSTPALAAAVSDAGGLGFVPAGYLPVERAAADVAAARRLTAGPLGLNLFAPPGPPGDPDALRAYAERLGPDAGAPRHDDDGWAEKLALAEGAEAEVVSFTFGCPAPEEIARLQAAGRDVWVTVTSGGEAERAAAAGADALVVQGAEAGGHRGTWAGEPENEALGVLALLRLVARAVSVPLVAAGGIGDGAAVAAVLAAGAAAAQVGSALLLAPEAGTSAPHRAALREGRATAVTRAFSGRPARGLVNRFMREHEGAAPAAYPEVHHLTAPLRAAARAAGDAEGINLWAGQAHALAEERPAGEIVRALGAGARAALADAARRVGAPA